MTPRYITPFLRPLMPVFPATLSSKAERVRATATGNAKARRRGLRQGRLSRRRATGAAGPGFRISLIIKAKPIQLAQAGTRSCRAGHGSVHALIG
jgi:hypothetical protein